MEQIEYVIVTEEMVWLFIRDGYKTRGFRELLGKEAKAFIAANCSPSATRETESMLIATANRGNA